MKIIELIFADLPYFILSSIFETIVFIIKSPFKVVEKIFEKKEHEVKDPKADPLPVKLVNMIVGGAIIGGLAWFFSKVFKINL